VYCGSNLRFYIDKLMILIECAGICILHNNELVYLETKKIKEHAFRISKEPFLMFCF